MVTSQNGSPLWSCLCITFAFASILDTSAAGLRVEADKLSTDIGTSNDPNFTAHTLSETTNMTSAGIAKLLHAAKQYRSRNGRQQLLRYRDINRALYMGDLERIRSFLHRMVEGKHLTVALLGGSVSKGMGATHGEPSFEVWLNKWFEAVAPDLAGGEGSTSSSNMSFSSSSLNRASREGGSEGSEAKDLHSISRILTMQNDLGGRVEGGGAATTAGSSSSSSSSVHHSHINTNDDGISSNKIHNLGRSISGHHIGGGGDDSGVRSNTNDEGASRSTVRVVNAACPATSSAYMNLCLKEYLRDTNVDLVLLEYAINDLPFPEPQMINEARRSFEQLVRKLLGLPSRPAVVLLNLYRWYSESVFSGTRSTNSLYFTNAEAQFFEFATYYGLPMISLKAAVYHHMLAGTRGFQIHALRHTTRTDPTFDPEALFYEDPIHPSGLTGHRVISELVVGLLMTVARGMMLRPWRTAEEQLIASAILPRHMLPDNFDTDLDVCLMGDNLKAAAVDVQGFEWLNEGRNPLAPKWGYTATTINSSIVFTISSAAADAAANSINKASPRLIGRLQNRSEARVMVILAYLRSYENMRVAAVSCEGDCVCGKHKEDEASGRSSNNDQSKVIARLDGLSEEHTSQLQLACFAAHLLEGHTSCRVRVKVEDIGRSGINKVKLGGLIVSHTAPETAILMCESNLEAAEQAAGFRE